MWVSGGGVALAPIKSRPQIVYPDGRVVYLDETPTAPEATPSAPSAKSSVSALFTAPLKKGSRGADVKRLQALLNVEQTGYFGPLTLAALQSFQEKYGVARRGEEGCGNMGPKTRAKLTKFLKGM